MDEMSLQVNVGRVRSTIGELQFTVLAAQSGRVSIEIFASDPTDMRKSGVLLSLDQWGYEDLKALISRVDEAIVRVGGGSSSGKAGGRGADPRAGASDEPIRVADGHLLDDGGERATDTRRSGRARVVVSWPYRQFSGAELIALRKVRDDFAGMTTSELMRTLGARISVDMGIVSDVEAREIASRASKLGLHADIAPT